MRYGFLIIIGITAALMSHAQKPVLNHVALQVTDLQQSTRFYQEVIGLDTIPEPFHDGKHAWLNLGGGAQLHLISIGTPGPLSKVNHLCFSIPSMDAFITRLKQHKIPFEDFPGTPNAITLRPDGVKQIYFQDPDGRWIEINDAK